MPRRATEIVIRLSATEQRLVCARRLLEQKEDLLPSSANSALIEWARGIVERDGKLQNLEPAA